MKEKYGLDKHDIQNYKYNFIKSLPGFINDENLTFYSKFNEQINKIRHSIGLKFLFTPIALSTHLDYLKGYQFILELITMDEYEISQFIQCFNEHQIQDVLILLGLNLKQQPNTIESIITKCKEMKKIYNKSNNCNNNHNKRKITQLSLSLIHI